MPAPDCLSELRKLYDAIMSLQSGKAVAIISIGERSVQYSQRDLKHLTQLFTVFYRQCGAESGLTDLSAGSMVERGPPLSIPR
jgi:hypothetical protein